MHVASNHAESIRLGLLYRSRIRGLSVVAILVAATWAGVSNLYLLLFAAEYEARNIQSTEENVATTTTIATRRIARENVTIDAAPEVFASTVNRLSEDVPCTNLWYERATRNNQQLCRQKDGQLVVQHQVGDSSSGWGGNLLTRYFNLYALAVWQNWEFRFVCRKCKTQHDELAHWIPQHENETKAWWYHNQLRGMENNDDETVEPNASIWRPLPFHELYNLLSSDKKGQVREGKCNPMHPQQCGGYYQNKWISTELIAPMMKRVIQQYRQHVQIQSERDNLVMSEHDMVFHLRCGDIILGPSTEQGFMAVHYWERLVAGWKKYIEKRLPTSSSPASFTIWIITQTTKESLRPGREYQAREQCIELSNLYKHHLEQRYSQPGSSGRQDGGGKSNILVKFVSRSKAEDFIQMVEAPFLVCGFSTFCYSAALANQNHVAVPFSLTQQTWPKTRMHVNWIWYEVGTDYITGEMRHQQNMTVSQLWEKLSGSSQKT